MLSTPRRALLGVLGLALGATGVLTGCNALDPFYDEGGSIENLVDDARFARDNGDFDRAVDLLEDAFEHDDENPEVRLELSSTLMQRDNLNLLDLERVTQHLLSAVESEAGTGMRGFAADTCTFDAGEAAVPFDPTAVEDYDDITGAGATLARVTELLNEHEGIESPGMPTELTSLNICSAIDGGTLNYDRDAVLAAVNDRFGDDAAATRALTVNAVALTLQAYVALFEQPDLPVDWFIVDGDDLGACMAESQFDLFVERAQGEVDRVGQALISLDLLLQNTGNDEYAEYVDDALEVYQTVETAELNPCFDSE